MRTTNVGAKMRVPIRAAGFRWRPYALRRYFDTRMMLAESEGIIIKDFRVFWMGHKGDIEHTYTVNKRLQEDIIERMRLAFGKASSKYLQTQSIAQASERAIISTFNMQILKTFGYTEEEIAKIPEAGDISPERIQELIKAKSMQMLGLNGNTQRVVSMEAVEEMILQGWEFVKDLPSNKAIVRLPK